MAWIFFLNPLDKVFKLKYFSYCKLFSLNIFLKVYNCCVNVLKFIKLVHIGCQNKFSVQVWINILKFFEYNSNSYVIFIEFCK